MPNHVNRVLAVSVLRRAGAEDPPQIERAATAPLRDATAQRVHPARERWPGKNLQDLGSGAAAQGKDHCREHEGPDDGMFGRANTGAIN